MENAVTSTEQVPEPTSFLTRAANVFSCPSEVYGEVSSLPVQTTSWLIPLLLSILVALAATFAIFNNSDLHGQIVDQQRQEMQKKVADGSMSQEQADKAMEYMGSTGGFVMIIGAVSAMVISAVVFLVVPLVLWGGARAALKFSGGYQKILEVYGLASLIGILGSIVTVLMMNALNLLAATPSGALLVMHSYDRHNTFHNLLAAVNIFTLWETGIVGLGLAKVTGKPAGQGMALAFGLWLVWAVVSSLLGWGLR